MQGNVVSQPLKRSNRPPVYWAPIAVFLVAAVVLFAVHLLSGRTPDRVAFSILGLPIYWYGIWIITGVVVGTMVVADLAQERAERAFLAAVPDAVRLRPLADVALSADLSAAAARASRTTLGEWLYDWGLDPRRLGLKKPDIARFRGELGAVPGVEPTWLDDAPWRQWNPDFAWGGLAVVLVLGVLGARLYHVLTPSPSMAAVGIHSALDYFRNPYQLLNFRNGGLGIFGAIVGGLLGIVLYTRRHRISTLGWADLAVVGMALGQSIGRWGNYFNQELYGGPTGLPWGITIDPVHRLPDVAAFERFHPAFLYESIWSFLSFLLLLWLARRKSERLLPGELLVIYLTLYAIGRTLLETVRLDSRTVSLFGLDLPLAVATVVSIGMAAAGILFVVIRRARRAGPASTGGPRQASAGQS
jgi:phosphatidylglycerol:prolipoprotein diacylglycerol transferase